jgi:hypothetical protein
MTDPLSITAGVVGLVSFAYSLCSSTFETFDKIADAPKHMQDVSVDLKSMYGILATLQYYLDDETTSKGVLHPMTSIDLEDILKNCIDIFQRLGTLVGHYRKDETTAGQSERRGEFGVWKRVRATWKEPQIKVLRNELAAHKLTLNVALATANQ